MNGQMLQSTLRELQALARKPRLWLVFAIVVALFAATGPFGTFDSLAAPIRTLYWLVMHAISWSIALSVVAVGKQLLSGRLEPALLRTLTTAAVAALPIGVAIILVNALFLGLPPTLASLPGAVATALPVSLALAWLTSLTLDGDAAAEPPTGTVAGTVAGGPATGQAPMPASAAPASAAEPPALIERLPVEKRGALIRLEVQDHYVLVVTEKGREMLLMRLADAIREAESGMQVHRSHWVAFDGVERLDREGGRAPRLTLHTRDGAAIPVSRSYAADVRARFG